MATPQSMHCRYGARELHAGSATSALAAGVNLTLSPAKTAMFGVTGELGTSELCLPTVCSVVEACEVLHIHISVQNWKSRLQTLQYSIL